MLETLFNMKNYTSQIPFDRLSVNTHSALIARVLLPIPKMDHGKDAPSQAALFPSKRTNDCGVLVCILEHNLGNKA